jgi:hypothetical protein
MVVIIPLLSAKPKKEGEIYLLTVLRILSFWHWGIAMAQGNLGIALQLLKRVVVVSYFYYWVSNAKLSGRFCIR